MQRCHFQRIKTNLNWETFVAQLSAVLCTLLPGHYRFFLWRNPSQMQFIVANSSLAGLGLLHRQTLGGQELLVSVDEKRLPSPLTDRSFQMTLQRDLDKLAAFVDIGGIRLEAAMNVRYFQLLDAI